MCPSQSGQTFHLCVGGRSYIECPICDYQLDIKRPRLNWIVHTMFVSVVLFVTNMNVCITDLD
jgi:hypothetical protein